LDASEANFEASIFPYYSNLGIYRGKTTAVGSFRPNALGLYDMTGNVWEWCWDWFNTAYPTESESNPRGPESGSSRVLRGSSWIERAYECRVSSRGGNIPVSRNNKSGFRVVTQN
jgi:formylglycine-generating enzyme required for sulfatase activity